jgi:hypothetical protein
MVFSYLSITDVRAANLDLCRALTTLAIRVFLRATPTATRELGLIRRTGTDFPQGDSNPEHKDCQTFAPRDPLFDTILMSNELEKNQIVHTYLIQNSQVNNV